MKVKYCGDCGKKMDWPTTGTTRQGRCSVCGEPSECFSKDSTVLPPKVKKAVKTITKKDGTKKTPRTPASEGVQKISGPMQVVEDGAEASTTVAKRRPGRKPARLTAEKARKLKESKTTAVVDDLVDKILVGITGVVEIGHLDSVDTALKEVGIAKKVQKTLEALGYEVKISDGQIEIKW